MARVLNITADVGPIPMRIQCLDPRPKYCLGIVFLMRVLLRAYHEWRTHKHLLLTRLRPANSKGKVLSSLSMAPYIKCLCGWKRLSRIWRFEVWVLLREVISSLGCMQVYGLFELLRGKEICMSEISCWGDRVLLLRYHDVLTLLRSAASVSTSKLHLWWIWKVQQRRIIKGTT